MYIMIKWIYVYHDQAWYSDNQKTLEKETTFRIKL